MSNAIVDKFKYNLELFQSNPGLIQAATFDMLRDATNGTIEVVDANNPFVFALEASSIQTAHAIDKGESVCRRLYPSMAQTMEELYYHMSDKDYADRFATPSKIEVGIALDLAEVRNAMVYDAVNGYSKIVIPRNTTVSIGDVTFSIQYPIEIRQLPHGGLQVVYDTTINSPVLALESNVIRWGVQPQRDMDVFVMFFNMQQFRIVTSSDQVTMATGFKKKIEITHQYYYARVYNEDADGNWFELKTTHSEQIHDPFIPTATIKVFNGYVEVGIPQIYINNEMVRGKVRVDIYETLGDILLNVGSYPSAAFEAQWLAIDKKRDSTPFTAPVRNLRTITIFSDSKTVGGTNALDFEKLRYRVIMNAMGPQQLPITQAQIESSLEKKGYSIVKNIDNLTNRVFLATRQLPTPSSMGLTFENKPLITAAAASIETMVISMHDLANIDTVIDNGDSVTITPHSLFQSKHGVLHMVPSAQASALLEMNVDQRALAVTQGNYLFTPFYYVLDSSKNEFDMRAYYLDNPEIKTKSFVAENGTTLMQISVGDYSITRSVSGYYLDIVTKSDDFARSLSAENFHVQLAFIPPGEKNRAYLNGILIDVKSDTKELVYRFNLATNFNIVDGDEIQFTQFKMFEDIPRIVSSNLTVDFDVIFSTSIVMSNLWMENEVDSVLGKYLLPERIAGISHEKLTVKIGDSLGSLWRRARSIVSSTVYATHEFDVQRTYTEDVYETDPVTGSVFEVVDGELVYRILHKKSELMFDSGNNPIYLYRAGDVVRDSNGNPVVKDPRKVLRQVDLLMVEGAYFFATDPVTSIYRQEMIRTFLAWIVEDLGTMSGRLLENTKIFFHPKATLGDIDVMIGDGRLATIAAGQAIKATLYVDKNVYANGKLRSSLMAATIAIVGNELDNDTVAMSDVVEKLKYAYGADVIDVRLTGLGGSANYQALTIRDQAKRCSLRKRLVARSDDTLAVEEDLTIEFVRHSLD